MNKFLIAIIILIALIAYFFFTREESTNTTPEDTQPTQNESFRPDPSNASYNFDDGSITLSNGRITNVSGEEFSLLEERAYGDINNDGKEDVVVLISRFGGGSGVFINAAAYVSGPVNYKGTNTIFIGDRVAPRSVSISDGVITINYLDRNPDEVFAAEPTVPASKQLVFRNGELVER